MSFLPPYLTNLREILSEQKNLEACLKIIKEYFAFLGFEEAKEELWLLLAATLTFEEANMQTAMDRSNAILYCGYTKMLQEAAHAIQQLFSRSAITIHHHNSKNKSS
jgi:hypothetical protein